MTGRRSPWPSGRPQTPSGGSSGWVTAAAVVGGGAVIAVAAILEQSSGGLDSDTNDAVAALFLSAVAFGLVSYLGYAVAGLVSARRAQRAVLTWLQGRDSGQVARGLPPRLLAPFLGRPPAHRLQMMGGIAGSVVGGGVLIAGVASVFVPAPAAVPAVLFPVGVVTGGVAVVLLRRARRAIPAQQQLAARLGGRRLAIELGGVVATGQ